MQLFLIPFGGANKDVFTAETKARAKASAWLEEAKIARSSIVKMETQLTYLHDEGKWLYLITFLVELEHMDWVRVNAINERFKNFPDMPEPVEEVPVAFRRTRKRTYQRTEAQERITVEQNNHRSRHMGAVGDITYEEWKMLCDLFDNVCLACKQPLTLSIDHVMPLSRGGENRISNIQPLCKRCNAQKRDKDTDYRDPEKMREFLVRIGQMPS